MYTVFEGSDSGHEKPCDSKHFSLTDSSWDISTFDTYEEALDYLSEWLGSAYNACLPYDLRVDEKVYFGGADSYVVIRQQD